MQHGLNDVFLVQVCLITHSTKILKRILGKKLNLTTEKQRKKIHYIIDAIGLVIAIYHRFHRSCYSYRSQMKQVLLLQLLIAGHRSCHSHRSQMKYVLIQLQIIEVIGDLIAIAHRGSQVMLQPQIIGGHRSCYSHISQVVIGHVIAIDHRGSQVMLQPQIIGGYRSCYSHSSQMPYVLLQPYIIDFIGHVIVIDNR